jgi:hypothetical protein
MANRFWVGGSGTWDASSTTNWSTTTGGAGGASVPGSADVAIFDANSGAGTCTLGVTVTVGFLTMTNYTGALDFSTYEINLEGNALGVFSGGTGYTLSGTKQLNCTYTGANARSVVGGTPTESNLPNVKIQAGTGSFTFSGRVNNVDFTGFSGSLGTGSFNIYGSLVFSASMTVAATANAITFNGAGIGKTITTNGVTVDRAVSLSDAGGAWALQDNLTMGSTRTFTLTAGTLDLTGNSGNWTLSTGLFSSNNSNTRSIAFGTGNITLTQNGTSIWRTDTSTGLTITGTPTVNLTYAGATGTRTITAGSTAGGSEAVAINLNVAAATDTVNLSVGSHIKNLTFTGFTGTAGVGYVAWGNLTLSAGMTISGSANGPIFSATSGITTITTNGVTFDRAISFVGIGGTFAFQDALTQGSTRAFTITEGTVQLKNGVTSTVGAFATSGTNQKFLQSTTLGSQATLSQASGTVDVSYLTIRDINATGGATWNAFTTNNNVNAGNNLGWDFSSQLGKYIYTRRKNKRILP